MSCAEIEGAGEVKLMELLTGSDIEIELLVPNENFVPLGVLRRAGNFVMQRVVDIGLPQVNLSGSLRWWLPRGANFSRNAVASMPCIDPAFRSYHMGSV